MYMYFSQYYMVNISEYKQSIFRYYPSEIRFFYVLKKNKNMVQP